MPALGSGTNFDIRRIDAHPYLATIVKGPVKEDPKLCQDFVWRLTTQIDFFSPRRSRPWQEQIGRMDVELDGSTHREYRLKDKEDKKGQVYKEWETYDSHKVERWRVALQPMMRARRHVATHLHDKPSEADFRRDIMAGRCIFRNGDSSLVGPAVVQAPGPPRPAHPHGAARCMH
ncbi:hypothetical protein KFL_000020580 [Klebsormidium nitens]|uniref:Uncharacterized protein n=1 Tax=Klebsormidium nitens TaxID=105231 RepID=A0A1Y1HGY5_KLENI|nr:hypothetical protein KFL_000020580 [Klebsormidium nitens]|eukprot:GAQ77695.1 hypothetical protein KFL_000020580 [Klebsormidium nitens]